MYLTDESVITLGINCESIYAGDDAPEALLNAAREELAGIFRAICIIDAAMRANRIRFTRLDDAQEELRRLRECYASVYSEIRDAFDKPTADNVHREVQAQVPADVAADQRLRDLEDHPLLAGLC